MNLIRRLNNPILFKELRLRMRNKKAPWAISLYLLVLGGIALTFIYLITGNQAYYSPTGTREIFMMLTILQFALISFVTPGLTAGGISGERERQTLSLLLTTNSTPTKIVIGKWLSSLSFMVFLVFASIPLYGIVFLFGGISPAQLIKVFAFYLISMLALGSFGILFSSIFKRTGVATVVTYGVIFAYTAGTFIGAEVLRQWFYSRMNTGSGTGPVTQQQMPIWTDLLYSINPLAAVLNIFNQGPVDMYRYNSNVQSPLPMDPYWIYFIFFGSITVLALLLAIYFLKPVRPRFRKK